MIWNHSSSPPYVQYYTPFDEKVNKNLYLFVVNEHLSSILFFVYKMTTFIILKIPNSKRISKLNKKYYNWLLYYKNHLIVILLLTTFEEGWNTFEESYLRD